MNRAAIVWALGSTLVLGGLSMNADAGKIKCWTNRDGVRECGNAVPPEYAQKGHEELSKHGLTVDRQQRAKTAEEIEAEQRMKEQKAAARREERQRAARDRVLLDTFTTEEDLRLANEGKMQAIESRIAHSKRITEKLNTTLDELQREAARLERSGKPVPDAMSANIADVQRQLEDNQEFIAERRAEQEALRIRFEADLRRYRELKERDG